MELKMRVEREQGEDQKGAQMFEMLEKLPETAELCPTVVESW